MPMTYAPHDLTLSQSFILSLPYDTPIDFQFPPKVTNDGRRGTWEEGETKGSEPLAVYVVSSARTIAISWVYMVDGQVWPATRIQKQVSNLRAYFQRSFDEKDDPNFLVGLIQMWGMGGKDPFTCRMHSVDIKHGDTIVGDVTSDSLDVYPLRTDVTVEIKLWTRGGQNTQVQNIAKLKPTFTQDWY